MEQSKQQLKRSMSENNELSFEDAYSRLEKILEKMSSESISLDLSLKMYEEADKLINICNKKLVDAEQKIEILTKNRSGELVLDENGNPVSQPFSPSSREYPS